MSRPMRMALFGAALMAATPVRSGDCWQLSPNFGFCAAGSDWVAVEWEQFGDGAALHLGHMSLDFTENWAGRAAIAEAPSAGGALSALLDWRSDEGLAQTVLERDSLSVPGLQVELARVVDEDSEDDPAHMILMIADAGDGAQLMLRLSTFRNLEAGALDRQAAAVIAGLRRQDARQTED